MTSKIDIIQNSDFRINNISNYLIDYKKILLSLGILDKNELNKNLTNSLNNLLLPQKTFEEKYKEIISKMKEVETNIVEIKKQIEEFNNKQAYVSFIDINDILYITYFDEISFVDRTIIKIKNYMDKDINLNYLYCYIINKFYDELTDSNKNYLFILEHRINDIIIKSDKTIIEQKILDFFSINKIKILKDIIKLIFDYDENYKNIIKKFNNDKFEFLKQIYSDNNILGDTKEILDFKPYFDIKNKFIEEKKIFLKKKREIILEEPALQIFYNKLFTEQIVITIEIWFGFILFITKHFTVVIDKLMNFFNKKLKPEFKINKDIFNDLETPMAKYVWILDKIGGNINFYKKYLKYKNKYLLAKKN
jgi:hypothetical protein